MKLEIAAITFACEAYLFRPGHLHADPARHVAGHPGLHGEDVPQIELIALCPKMALGRRLDQLHRDAYCLSARVEHGAFEKCVDRELPGNLRQRHRGLPVPDHRLVRKHLQCADPAKFGDQRLRHPVHEVVLLRIAGEVLKWEHRNRGDVEWGPSSVPFHVSHDERDRGNRQRGRHEEATSRSACPRRQLLEQPVHRVVAVCAIWTQSSQEHAA